LQEDIAVNLVKGQLEKSPAGVIHYQLLIRFANAKTISAAKTYIATALHYPASYIHLEVCEDFEAQLKYVVKAKNGFDSWDDPNLFWTIGAQTDAGIDKKNKSAAMRKLMRVVNDADGETSNEAKRARFEEIVKEELPNKWIFDRGTVNRALNTCFPLQSAGKRYELATFNRPPLELPTKDDDKPWSYLLVGESGTGKTKFALAHFANPLLISQKEDYNKLPGDYDGMVIDDMAFHKYSVQNLIHLTDVGEDRTVNVKYGSARIPAYLPRIFTINDLSRFMPEGMTPTEERAIRRRIRIIDVPTHLYREEKCEIPLCNCKSGGGPKMASLFAKLDKRLTEPTKKKEANLLEELEREEKMADVETIRRIETRRLVVDCPIEPDDNASDGNLLLLAKAARYERGKQPKQTGYYPPSSSDDDSE
jgi:hypothetical protein